MKDIKGWTVLVTGAASGIGLCTAEEFAKAGATLVVTDRNAPALEEAAEGMRRRHGATVHARTVDVTRRAEVDALAAWIESDLGGLDVLVNNAGVGHHGALSETSLETWAKLIDVNLWGPLYHTYAFLPGMRRRGKGRIVNVCSGQVFFQLPTWGAYAAVKAAVAAFSEVLHFEVSGQGIHVTTVYPFLVNTPFYEGVHGGTWADRLSMRLLPWTSMTPERVGRIVFEAAVHGRRVEMVSPINLVGYYTHLAPPLAAAVSAIATRLLAPRSKKEETHAHAA
jgi:NAD(P)-dependent dehydrogenase (short-subunit alcohol dehydrogenase family)